MDAFLKKTFLRRNQRVFKLKQPLLRPRPHLDPAGIVTLLRQGGECEGWIPCYVSSQGEPLSTFLKAYPDSALADAAVERALAAFAMIETDKDLRASTDSSDPEDIRKLTASLEEV